LGGAAQQRTGSLAAIRQTLQRSAGDLFQLEPIGDEAVGLWNQQRAPGLGHAGRRIHALVVVANDRIQVQTQLRVALAHRRPPGCEDPCFLGSLNILHSTGLAAVPVTMDAHGMRPQALEAALANGAQAVLCTPRAQNPTGCGLSEQRARELRRVLARHPHVLVIEDDHFALLAEAPYFSIAPAATARRALVRSVSKGFGPDLRLAFIATDAGTAARLGMRLAPGTTWVSHLLQAAVRGLLGSDASRARLLAAKAAYATRRKALIDALSAEGIAARQPCDGFNVWIPLPEGRDVHRTAQSLARCGWAVRTGDAFAIAPAPPALRVTVSTLEPGDAARFAAQLRDCLGRV